MTEERAWPRRLWESPWAWTAAGLCLRLALAAALGNRQHQTDEMGQAAAAWSLASSGVLGYDGQAKAIPPLPAAFFAPWFALLGGAWRWPRLAQACLAAGLIPVLGALARRLLDSEKAGLAAVRVCAVYPFFVYYSGMLMTETVYTVLSVPALLLFCLSLKEGGRRAGLAAAAGGLGGLAGLTRTEGAVIFLVLYGFLALAAALGRYSRRAWLAGAAVFLLPLAGWSARNKKINGVFALDNHGGITFYTGTALYEADVIDTRVAMNKFYAGPLYARIKDLDETSFDRECFRAAVEFMKEHPRRTLWQWWRKTISFWRLYPRTDRVYDENEFSHPSLGLGRSVLVAVSLLFEPALLGLGVWGFWRQRRRWTYTLPIPLFILGSWAAHMLTVSTMRYRVPVMAYFMIFLAAGVSRRAPQADG